MTAFAAAFSASGLRTDFIYPESFPLSLYLLPTLSCEAELSLIQTSMGQKDPNNGGNKYVAANCGAYWIWKKRQGKALLVPTFSKSTGTLASSNLFYSTEPCVECESGTLRVKQFPVRGAWARVGVACEGWSVQWEHREKVEIQRSDIFCNLFAK